MPQILAAMSMVLLVGSVLTRVIILRHTGTHAMHFGRIDKSDFLIPPFALFYIYSIFAAAFDLPLATHPTWPLPAAFAWAGVALCVAGFALLVQTLASFGASFRVGIDTEHPDTLITTGIFAYTRNPTYVAFACVLLGQLLVLPNWLMLVYLLGGIALLHRQVLREEAFMKEHYGQPFTRYCQTVRRYL